MRDTVLVTGASGFVGAAVARAALGRGFRVKVLMRPAASRANIDGLDVKVVVGDMRDAASMTAAMRGARYLFHVAADYRLWSRDPSGDCAQQSGRGAGNDDGGLASRCRAGGLYVVRCGDGLGGKVSITNARGNHPQGVYAFRVEHAGKVFV